MVDMTQVKPVRSASNLAKLCHPWVVWSDVMIKSNAPVPVVKSRYCSNVGEDPFKVSGVVEH